MNLSHKLIKLAARTMLGLAACGSAWAACDVSLVTVFANGQAVLKADCGTATISSITWLQTVVTSAPPASPVTTITTLANNLIVTPTTQDIYYTTAITTGTSTFTANGNGGAVVAGKAATITSGQTALHVAANAGGTVTSSPIGINCTNTGGACDAPFALGAIVTLTTTASTGFSFSNWAGDCSGAGACVLTMTSPRTVVATFNNVPACTLSANPSTVTAGSSSTLTATCSPAAASYVWTGANCSSASASCTVTPAATTAYTVAGTNAGGTGAPASTTVNVTQVPPTCTVAANPGSVVFGVATTVTLTASCTNSPTSYSWTNGSGSPAATGTGNSVTAAFPATAVVGTYAYSVTASNSGGASQVASTSVSVSAVPPPVCTLSASPSSVSAGTATTVQLTASCTNSPTGYSWTTGSGSPAVSGVGNIVTAAFSKSIAAGTYAYSVTASNGASSSPASTSVTVATGAVLPPNCVVKDITGDFGASITNSAAYGYQDAAQTWAYRITYSQLFSAARQGYGASGLFGRVYVFESNNAIYSISLTTNPCEFHNAPPAGFCQTQGYPGSLNGEFSLKYRASIEANSPSACILPAPAGQLGNESFWYVNLRHAAGPTVEDPYTNTCNQAQCARYLYREP